MTDTRSSSSPPPSRVSPADAQLLRRLLWAPTQPPADVARWHQQGFTFQAPTAACPLGLLQGHGGPCGVLAAVQAELLRQWLFPERTAMEVVVESEPQQYDALARALAALLYHCAAPVSELPNQATHAIRVVTLAPDMETTSSSHSDEQAYVEELVLADSPDNARVVASLARHQAHWRSQWGVVLFMMSVLRSKRVEAVRLEMDDAESALTGPFGHCGQELLNLLLTGVASSNVFDGVVPMGDTGLLLTGVSQRPRIGYLTQLEALRYCQVGSYYKSPLFPVWVVGSASHFSVCFARDRALCEESASQRMLQRVQRAFQRVDTMETGMMEVSRVAESLAPLDVSPALLQDEYALARLAARLEVSGAGLVLWDEYWKVVSVLLHTHDLETALRGDYRMEQERTVASEANRRPQSDEEIAQALQAQFDAESRAGGGRDGNGNGDGDGIGAGEPPGSTSCMVTAMPRSFDLFYYNGLTRHPRTDGDGAEGLPQSTVSTPPSVVRVQVTLPPSREFIGQSVPIDVSTATSSHGLEPPLEEILRTKWPGAVFDWGGTPVPSVD